MVTVILSPLVFLASGATSQSGFRTDCPEKEALKDGERKSEDQSSYSLRDPYT